MLLRVYLYKNITFFSKIIKNIKNVIGVNLEQNLELRTIQMNEIIHLAQNHKDDLGILNFVKIFMLNMKVSVINRYKIFDENLAEDNRNHIKLSYCIRSLINQGKRLVISISKVERSKLIDAAIPSLTSIYNSASWLEREIFDLFGIKFKNNIDLRRILTDYGFVGSPFKKDFPLIGYKELSYNSENGSVCYKKISLLQEFRNFEMINPWK